MYTIWERGRFKSTQLAGFRIFITIRYPTLVLLIFDLDGTISDSYQGIDRAFRHALTKLDHAEATRNAYHEFIGAPLPNAFSMLLEIPVEETKAAVDYFREYYSVSGWKENELYDGILPLLSNLREQGHTLAVATNKPTFFAEKILNHFGADHYFDCIVGQELGYVPSKKAALIQKVLSNLNHTEGVYIGDSVFDIEAGKACNMPVIAVGYGFGTEQELKNALPDYYAHSVTDLQTCIADYVGR